MRHFCVTGVIACVDTGLCAPRRHSELRACLAVAVAPGVRKREPAAVAVAPGVRKREPAAVAVAPGSRLPPGGG